VKLIYAEDQVQTTLIILDAEYGSLDFHKLWELEQHLITELNNISNRLLIVCGTTSHAGCGFVNVILRCRQHVNFSNKRLGICVLNPLTIELFALCKLENPLKIHETRQEAIEAMKV